MTTAPSPILGGVGEVQEGQEGGRTRRVGGWHAVGRPTGSPPGVRRTDSPPLAVEPTQRAARLAAHASPGPPSPDPLLSLMVGPKAYRLPGEGTSIT